MNLSSIRCLLAVPLLVAPLAGPSATETAHGQSPVVAPGVSDRLVEADLPMLATGTLNQLLKDPAKRLAYAKKLYSDLRLDEAVTADGLDRSQPLLAALYAARKRLLVDALVGQALDKMGPDIEALARERYESHPGQYRVRKKIKLAIIFIDKVGREAEARAEVEDVEAQLKKDPDNPVLFGELAKKHSEDKWAKQGGFNDKWLIAPLDLQKSLPMVRAAFALEDPGQVTDIVETKQGFAIAKLMAVTPGTQLGFEQAKGIIVKRIRAELEQRKRAEILGSLQAPADFALTDDAALKEMIAKEKQSRMEPKKESGVKTEGKVQ